MTVTFEEFRTYYAPEIAKIPKIISIRAIREAIIEFCRHTKILLVDADPISVGEDGVEYDIVLSRYLPVSIEYADLIDDDDNTTEIAITSMRALSQSEPSWKTRTTPGDITKVYLTQSGKARVFPIQTADLDKQLRLLVSVVPTRVAVNMPDDLIYDDYIEQIKYGVLSRIFNMKDQEWYRPDLAANHKVDFELAKVNARTEALKGKGSQPTTALYEGSFL